MKHITMNASKWLIGVLCSLLIFTTFSTPASAAATVDGEEDFTEAEIEELAQHLEFIFEEAVQYDEDGFPIDVDLGVLENNSDIPVELIQELISVSEILEEASVVEEEPTFGIMAVKKAIREKGSNDYNKAADKCISKRIAKDYKSITSISALTTLAAYIGDKQYTKAAKQMLKLGIKGNIYGLAGTFAYYMGSCYNNPYQKI